MNAGVEIDLVDARDPTGDVFYFWGPLSEIGPVGIAIGKATFCGLGHDVDDTRTGNRTKA